MVDSGAGRLYRLVYSVYNHQFSIHQGGNSKSGEIIEE
jgi:hypothetical protein